MTRLVALADCCEIVSGATPKTDVPGYWDGDIAWATPADLSKLEGAHLEETPRHITSAGLASCGATVLPPGSVLLSSRAPIGHVAINARPMATNQGFKSLIPRREITHAKYLYHWLRANKEYLQSLGNGATFKEISKAVVARVEVPLPPLSEQRRIAEILDRMDALEAKRREAIGKLDLLTQAIFAETFRAQVYAAHPLSDLVDRDDRINYGVVQPGSHFDDGVPLIRVSDLRGGGGVVDRSRLKRIAPEVEAQYVRSRIRGTEILVSCVGSIGTVAVASSDDVGSNVARAVARVPISDPELRVYVAALLSSPQVQRYFEKELRTVSQPTLNIKQLAETAVPVPPATLLADFAARVRALQALRPSFDAATREVSVLSASMRDFAFAGLL